LERNKKKSERGKKKLHRKNPTHKDERVKCDFFQKPVTISKKKKKKKRNRDGKRERNEGKMKKKGGGKARRGRFLQNLRGEGNWGGGGYSGIGNDPIKETYATTKVK